MLSIIFLIQKSSQSHWDIWFDHSKMLDENWKCIILLSKLNELLFISLQSLLINYRRYLIEKWSAGILSFHFNEHFLRLFHNFHFILFHSIIIMLQWLVPIKINSNWLNGKKRIVWITVTLWHLFFVRCNFQSLWAIFPKYYEC